MLYALLSGVFSVWVGFAILKTILDSACESNVTFFENLKWPIWLIRL